MEKILLVNESFAHKHSHANNNYNTTHKLFNKCDDLLQHNNIIGTVSAMLNSAPILQYTLRRGAGAVSPEVDVLIIVVGIDTLRELALLLLHQ